jgi:glucosamine-6-phosphate deaminase
MKICIFKNYEDVSFTAAQIVSDYVGKKPECVLGLATGSTPEGMYRHLVKLNRDGKVDFSGIKTFNLDEYVGLCGNHQQSYRYYMDNKFFNHINIKRDNINIPDGMADDLNQECRNYDEKIANAGGIDLQILGLGKNGHIGFNEPSKILQIGTHITELTASTIEANARFFNSDSEVPRNAITVGLGSIIKSRKILLIACGKEKSEIVTKLIDSDLSTEVPATILKLHNDTTILLDEEAASQIKDKSLISTDCDIYNIR